MRQHCKNSMESHLQVQTQSQHDLEIFYGDVKTRTKNLMSSLRSMFLPPIVKGTPHLQKRVCFSERELLLKWVEATVKGTYLVFEVANVFISE